MTFYPPFFFLVYSIQMYEKTQYLIEELNTTLHHLEEMHERQSYPSVEQVVLAAIFL